MKRKKFGIKRLSIRITLYFSITVVIAFLIFSLIIASFFTDKLTAEMDLVVGQKMNMAESLLSSSLNEIKSVHFSLIDNYSLQKLIKEQNGREEEISLERMVSVKKEFERIRHNKNSYIRSIFLINNDGKILDPIYATEPYNWIVSNNPEYDRFLESHLSGRFSTANSFPMSQKKDGDNRNLTITYFGQFYDRENYNVLGSIAINVTQSSVFNEINKLFQAYDGLTYVIDENNNIVFENKRINIDKDIFSKEYGQGERLKINNKLYQAYTRQISFYPNWKIVEFVDYEQIAKPILRINLTILIAAVIVLLVVVLASFSISQTITTPITQLNFAMDSAGRGEWPEHLHIETNDEMKTLVDGFNAMVISLKRLTKQVISEQEAKKKIEVAMVKSQLELLQSQINPHFIHNTLNTMKYLAQKAGAKHLADVITSFNSLLRASMSQENMMNTVLEEINNLNNYIKIQLERYDVMLEFVCDISEESKTLLIPKLILQPLVENSLFHGIVPIGKGKICVNTRVSHGRMWISVWDNGAGMPEDKIEDIISGKEINRRGYNQIGLSNVSERLVLNYGDLSRLVIVSQVGKGTTISFSIPINT